MQSIAAERTLAGRDMRPLKGSVAAPLPPHVRGAIMEALDEHAVTPHLAREILLTNGRHPRVESGLLRDPRGGQTR